MASFVGLAGLFVASTSQACPPPPVLPPLQGWEQGWIALPLLAFPPFAVAHRRWLRAELSEEQTMPGDGYRDTKLSRVLSPVVSRAWGERAAGASLPFAMTTTLLFAATRTWASFVVAVATCLGAALFLMTDRGRASLLYLPLMASAFLLADNLLCLGAIPPLLVFATMSLRAWVQALSRPRGDYEARDVGLPREPDGGASYGWTALLVSLVSAASLFCIAISLPRYRCDSPIKTTEGNAREIRNAVNRWHGAKGEAACPTIQQLVADKEIDAASKTDDSWGCDYRISCTEDDVFVVSSGPDRRFGTEDDISVPKGGVSCVSGRCP